MQFLEWFGWSSIYSSVWRIAGSWDRVSDPPLWRIVDAGGVLEASDTIKKPTNEIKTKNAHAGIKPKKVPMREVAGVVGEALLSTDESGQAISRAQIANVSGHLA